MSTQEAIKLFRKIYPEREVFCSASTIDDRHCLVDATFPDGNFYFIVTSNSVSSSYNTKEDAIQSIKC